LGKLFNLIEQSLATLRLMRAILFAIGAGLCWGVGEIFTKMVLHTGKVGPMTAAAVRTLAALPVLWLAQWILVHAMKSEPADWYRAGGPIMAKLLLGSGVIAGGAALAFFYAALKYGEASKVKPIAFAVAPLVGVLLGWLVLGESMNIRKVAGVALVIAGVVALAGA